jgi:ribulose 1,5-bisphosphate synthetase/thiazole synthase
MQVEDKIWDVVILGGGFAGCAAAVEAASNGKTSLLIDRRPVPGWELTWAHAPMLSVGRGKLYKDLHKNLTACGGLREGRIDPAIATIVLDEILESQGVTQLLYSQPLKLLPDNDRAQAVIVGCKGGQKTIRGKTFVDATENGMFWEPEEFSASPAKRSRFSCYFHVKDNNINRATFGEAAAAQYIKQRPGVFKTSLEVSYELDNAAIGDARVALPDVLKKLRTSGDFPVDAVLTHTAPELLPISLDVLEGEPGQAHHTTENLFAAGQWLIGFSPADDVLSELSAWGSIAGQSAAELSATIPCPASASLQEVGPQSSQSCDVLVAGGGTAGALAALAASRRGARTVLIESGTSLGGITTSGGIHIYYCGIPGGLQDQLDQRVADIADLFAPADSYRGYHPEARKTALEIMLREAGAKVLYGQMLTGVLTNQKCDPVAGEESSENSITEALCSSAVGSNAWRAKVYIDSTGDGDLAALAGAETISGRDCDGLPHAYSLSSGRFEDGLMQVVNFDVGYVDATDSQDLTRARRQAMAVYRSSKFTLKNRPTYIAPLLGLRSSRQIICDYQISLSDQIEGRRFDDAIAESFGHYDSHANDYQLESDQAMFWVWVLGNWSRRLGCEIPYRSLLPRNIQGLLIACRAFGVNYDSHMMLRMQNDMQRLGEVSGIAAALSVADGCAPRDLDPLKLRSELNKSGAMLPANDEPRFTALWHQQLAALDSLPSQDNPKDLINELSGQRSSEAMLALLNCSGDSAKTALAELLSSADRSLAYRAAAILAMHNDSRAIPTLLEAIKNQLSLQRQALCKINKIVVPDWVAAIALLGRLRAREATESLIALIKSQDSSFDIVLTAVRALGRIADPDSGDALCCLLTNEKLDCHRSLQSSSGKLSAPTIDGRWQLDFLIVKALAALGIDRSNALEKYQADNRALVRSKIQELTAEIASQSLKR